MLAITTKEAMCAARREELMLHVQAVVPPAESLLAQAAADNMSLPQLDGYLKLLCMGDSYASAASIMNRCPDHLVDTAVHVRGSRNIFDGYARISRATGCSSDDLRFLALLLAEKW